MISVLVISDYLNWFFLIDFQIFPQTGRMGRRGSSMWRMRIRTIALGRNCCIGMLCWTRNSQRWTVKDSFGSGRWTVATKHRTVNLTSLTPLPPRGRRVGHPREVCLIPCVGINPRLPDPKFGQYPKCCSQRLLPVQRTLLDQLPSHPRPAPIRDTYTSPHPVPPGPQGGTLGWRTTLSPSPTLPCRTPTLSAPTRQPSPL